MASITRSQRAAARRRLLRINGDGAYLALLAREHVVEAALDEEVTDAQLHALMVTEFKLFGVNGTVYDGQGCTPILHIGSDGNDGDNDDDDESYDEKEEDRKSNGIQSTEDMFDGGSSVKGGELISRSSSDRSLRAQVRRVRQGGVDSGDGRLRRWGKAIGRSGRGSDSESSDASTAKRNRSKNGGVKMHDVLVWVLLGLRGLLVLSIFAMLFFPLQRFVLDPLRGAVPVVEDLGAVLQHICPPGIFHAHTQIDAHFHRIVDNFIDR